MLKLAGVKSEAAFYKKYPTQEAFMKVHGKAFKKAQVGTYIGGETNTVKPINFKDVYDKADLSITGKTNDMRKEEAYKQASLAAQQKQGSGGGGFLDSITPMLGKLAESGMGDAKYGKSIPTAQFGNMFDGGFHPGNINVPAGIGYTPMSTGLTQSGFQMPNSAQSFASNNSLPAGMPGTESSQSGVFDKIGGAVGKYAGPAAELYGGYKALRAERQLVKAAQQTEQLSQLALQASNTRPEKTQRRYVRPEDMITAGNQLSPTYGTGTNILAKNGKKLKKGGEIQNTYAPNNLYTDLGYDSDNIQKYEGGGSIPWDVVADQATNLGQSLTGGPNAGGSIGKTAGKALGNMIVPGLGGIVGGVIGGLAGNALDRNGQRIKKSEANATRNTQGVGFGQGVQDYLSQNSAVTKNGGNISKYEDGGYVSNDWTPQVITKFGDHSAKDIYDFAHEGMESLRAGGQIRGEYTPVSEEGLQTYALGGEVETTWGGKVKPIARNPYLPNSGEIVEFKGNSHTESDGNGHKGIGVQYKTPDSYTEYAEFGSKTAQADVEVQGGEPGHIDDKGNFNVGGALRLVPKMAKQTGSPELIKLANKYDSMKVQDIIKKNADQTNNVNKKMIKVTDQLSSLKPVTSFEAIEQKSLEAMKDGYDKQLQGLAGEVNTITNWQTSVNDTVKDMSEKLGYKISADHLARYGTVKKDTDPVTKDSKAKIGKKLTKPEASSDIEMPTHINNRLYNKSASEEYQSLLPYDTIGDKEEQDAQALSYETLKDPESATNQNSWLTALNSVLPYVRPSNARPLDQRQILGELSALSMNQLEPVQAQRYNPQLTSSSTISLQDQINEITAQTRAAQRMAQGNPAAQAMIASQAYEAINKVKGEEFRTNQDRTDKTYAANINTLNDAQLKNLGIFSKQSADQSLAKSNTKAVQQAALQSISDKYLQNEAANKKLQVAENTYNYRYDSAGRLINMNPLQYFTPSGAESKSGGKGLAPGYEFTYDSDQNIIGTRKTSKEDVAKNGTKLKAKNGSIVKAIKNL